jgi:hypothetical protein
MSSPDQEPPMRITYGEDQELLASPENTVVYTFLGKTALGALEIHNPDVNHVYIKTGDDTENTTKGMYIFEKFHPDLYKTIADYAIRNCYPQLLNMRQIPECDLRSWMNHKDIHDEQAIDEFLEGLPDFLPEDFK